VYCTLGGSLFLLGVLFSIKQKNSPFPWLLMLAGTVIAVGSKENMGILLAAYLLVVVLQIHRGGGKLVWPIISFCLSAAWSAWIYTVIFQRIRANSADMYGNPVSLAGRLDQVAADVNEERVLYAVVLLSLLTGLAGWLLPVISKKRRYNFQILFLGAALILLLLISQEFFYSGNIWGRYNYPIALAVPLMAGLIIYFGKNIEGWIHHERRPVITNLLAAIFILFVLIHPVNWVKLREAAKENVNKTNLFVSKVDDAAQFLSSNPKTALVLYGNDAGSDYETTASYTRFLRARSIQNPIYILRDPPADYPTVLSGLELELETELINISENGFPDWTISPMTNLQSSSSDCLLLTLNIDHPAPLQCSQVLDGDVMIHYRGLYEHWQ
jgi:hypothetical protein